MKDKCFSLFGRTLNQCREWAFYIFGFVLLQAVLIWLWQSHGPSEYIAHSRKFGTFGIAVAVAYKTIVLTVLIVTHPKTALDRRFIWHLGSMDALLIYALIVNFFPEWAGLPPSAMQRPPLEPNDRMVIAATIWFNIIGFIMWSSVAVLNSLWAERFRYVWIGRKRILRSRLESPERAENASS